MLRCYVGPEAEDAQIGDLRFLSVDEFQNAIADLVGAFAPVENNEHLNSISDSYSPLLQKTAVVQPYFGSCAVYLPPSLTLDLAKICASSGYIHSCGINVRVRNVYKETRLHFIEALKRHLAKYRGDNQKIIFEVYSQRDFRARSLIEQEEIKNGLEDVQIPLEKFYLDDAPLTEFLVTLREAFSAELVVPEPGHYQIRDSNLRRRTDIDRKRTLWLIVDHDVLPGSKQPGDRHYFICYEQRFRNRSGFSIFDENKPGWLDHTTMPHSLVTAMINVTRSWWLKVSPRRICDPFAGSGTTWLEDLRLVNAEVSCSDLHPISPTVAQDNLAFFRSQPEDLANLINDLEELKDVSHLGRLAKSQGHLESECSTHYVDALRFYRKHGGVVEENREVWSEAGAEFSNLPVRARLLYYILLRVAKRHTTALDYGSTDAATAFIEESQTLVDQIKDLIGVKKAVLGGRRDRADGVVEFPDTYSLGTGIRIDATSLERSVFRQGDVVNVLNASPDAFDLIITDPPYGFNTHEPSLAELYSRAIPAMIRSLRDGGQLIFAVPEWSHIGRHLPTFVHKDFIAHQVLVSAEAIGREVIRTAAASPKASVDLRAPYYWQSGKALRRAILHFRFRRLPAYERLSKSALTVKAVAG